MHIRSQYTPALSGTLTPPSSKSQNIRGIFFATLAKGKSTLLNPLTSDDTADAYGIAQALGVHIQLGDNHVTLNSTGIPFETSTDYFYSGNSGLTTLFSLPLLGFRAEKSTVTFDCGEQMRKRPIAPLVEALNQLGMHIHPLKNKGECPLSVSGHLLGGNATVDGLNSQYLSALLISLPCAPKDSEIIVNNLHERPYIEMTLNWLKKQQIQYIHHRHPHADVFSIQKNQHYQPIATHIPGDFSSASCLIAAAALIPGEVVFLGLDMNEPQGDKILIQLLQEMGANITIEKDRLIIRGGKKLKGMDIDANDFPDLIPALSVIATQATGKTRLINVAQARIKETDRIHSMSVGLTRMGARVETTEDGMTIWQSTLNGAHVKGFEDHRTVMALCVAGLLATGETAVDDADAVNKTFPTFIEKMKLMGAKIR
jgi:3-phosphoshikimate 1-carboxyvinyltransferase